MPILPNGYCFLDKQAQKHLHDATQEIFRCMDWMLQHQGAFEQLINTTSEAAESEIPKKYLFYKMGPKEFRILLDFAVYGMMKGASEYHKDQIMRNQ